MGSSASPPGAAHAAGRNQFAKLAAASALSWVRWKKASVRSARKRRCSASAAARQLRHCCARASAPASASSSASRSARRRSARQAAVGSERE
eukprot:11702798-Alexandrium_andersonii.AAC.1